MLLKLENIQMSYGACGVESCAEPCDKSHNMFCVGAHAESHTEPRADSQILKILQDVSFELDRGQCVAVVAASGVGKSTLLSIAGLLLEPTSGSVFLDGENMLTKTDDQKSEVRATKIGFMFQHTQMVGALKAIDNVLMPARFSSVGSGSVGSGGGNKHGDAHTHARTQARTQAQVKEYASQMLDEFGLLDKAKYYPHQLSVGQKRRLSAARALINNPDLIIADEPTNDLDEANASVVIDKMMSRVHEGKSGLLLATHDMSLASKADHIIELEKL